MTKMRGDPFLLVCITILFPSRLSRCVAKDGDDVKRARSVYFSILSTYFDEDLSQDSASRSSSSSLRDDPFACLRFQREHGWWHGQRDKKEDAPVIELLGIEGAGHHAMHALFGDRNETGNGIRWRGASWPAGSTWRNSEKNRGHPFQTNIRSRPNADLLASLKGSEADLYIILARVRALLDRNYSSCSACLLFLRLHSTYYHGLFSKYTQAPGSCASSALRRFGSSLDCIAANYSYSRSNGKGLDLKETRKRIGRQIVAQRDTQWENLAVLSAYARILPCQVLLLTARIGHTLGNFCSTSHQHEL